MIDPLGVKSWELERGVDFVLVNTGDVIVFQKADTDEIRIIEIEPESRSVTNRRPMFLEEVLIRELLSKGSWNE